MLIVLLGRSTEGVLRDVRREFGERDVLVVARDGDTLEPPPGLATVPVSAFRPSATEHYTLIANGGTSAQLLPVVKRLVEAGVPFEAWDLQRDGPPSRVW